MARHTWTEPYHYDIYLSALENPQSPRWELIEELNVARGSFNGSGHAWIVRDTVNGVICLQSYATIVSIYLGDGEVRSLGNWSRTTSRHQSAFAARMRSWEDGW